NPAGAPAAIKGSVSLAIAKNTFFVTTDTTLLEQVLRPGGSSLAENAAFQSVAKEVPERISGMTYVRPNEQARVSYDLLNSGQFEKAFLQQAVPAGRLRGLPPLAKFIPSEKLPEFSVVAKYLSSGGSYSVMDDDGFTMTGFTLRRSGP